MNLNDLTTGDTVTARVYKSFGARTWANNYELQVAQLQSSPATELLVLAQTLAAWEASFLLQGVRIFRVVISTWQPDSVPYNPNSFLSLVVNEEGTRQAPSEALPLEMCLFVRRVASFGRNGKLLYRGVLTESDVGTAGFDAVLTNQAMTYFQSQVNAILNNPTFNTSWNFVLAKLNPPSIRNVNFLVVSNNVVFKKRNNAYFDRRNIPPFNGNI